ncbi:hypothetical protein CDN99_23035 [Roseateles aquatilis]|uniref:Uncharacterized protein n=1 Tax=Roseateles aquatilis TaxID=431061 RepID=A0A246IZ66_9BURK|nr:hypothetical protein [Roseateles aquatilis]OWQ85089.1 hypothetical protein CDN99_23035 [Roseateles aquatilis]
MSEPSIEHLLRPSLSVQEAPAQAPFSSQAQFLTAFFGGPLAMLFCLTGSIHRMRRWRQDGVFFALLAVASLGLAVLPWLSVGAPLRDACMALLGKSGPSTWVTLIALLGALASIHRHRRERRAAEMMGLKSENAFLSCLAMVIVAGFVSYMLSRFGGRP